MQTIKKFQIGRKYYPSNSNKIVLMIIKEREGKELTVVKTSTEETFTITASLTADEKGAYEYFLFDGLRIQATHILPLPRKVSEEEYKAITEAIKRDIEYRKARGLDRASVITEHRIKK